MSSLPRAIKFKTLPIDKRPEPRPADACRKPYRDVFPFDFAAIGGGESIAGRSDRNIILGVTRRLASAVLPARPRMVRFLSTPGESIGKSKTIWERGGM